MWLEESDCTEGAIVLRAAPIQGIHDGGNGLLKITSDGKVCFMMDIDKNLGFRLNSDGELLLGNSC